MGKHWSRRLPRINIYMGRDLNPGGGDTVQRTEGGQAADHWEYSADHWAYSADAAVGRASGHSGHSGNIQRTEHIQRTFHCVRRVRWSLSVIPQM